jgi:hypothetical protein
MVWSEQDVNAVDALSVIRNHPQMYLGERVVTAGMLARRVADDARLLGCELVEIDEREDWWLVGADLDWLSLGQHPPSDPLELFRRAWPFLEAGDNSMRCEVLVAAFAQDVFTATACNMQFIQGAAPSFMLRQWIAGRGSLRVIGFRMGDSLDSSV